MKDIFQELCFAVQELHKQEHAAHTIHQILFNIKEWLPLSQAALVIKNNTTDFLEIQNRYNIADKFAKNYRRDIGSQAIAKVLYQDEIVILNKSDASPEDYQDLRMDLDYEGSVAIRITDDNYPAGFLALYFNNAFNLDDDTRCFLKAIAQLCAEALRKERMTASIIDLRRTDSATGLYTSDYFHQKFREEYMKCQRYGNDLSLAIMDMDNYKEVLSMYGEQVAEKLFKELAIELRSCIRNIDTLGRRGIDECMLYLPNTTLANAQKVLQRFMEEVQSKTFTEKNLSTSVSVGLAAHQKGYMMEDIINKAQVAFYHARLSGKGQIKAEN